MNLESAQSMMEELEGEVTRLSNEQQDLRARMMATDISLGEARELKAALATYLSKRGVATTDHLLPGFDVGGQQALQEPDPLLTMPERSRRLVALLSSGPRDWHLNAILDGMEERRWLEGLKKPREAVRIALDRMTPGTVVRVRPATYALRRRLADRAPADGGPPQEAT